jgi:AcrR family transcriptional regulator
MAKQLKELGPQHHAAIRLRAGGASPEEIAEELGVERQTVYVWFSDPLVKCTLDEQIRLINERFAEQLAAAANRALPELLDVAMKPAQGAPTFDVKLKALLAILDRCPPTARVSGQVAPPERSIRRHVDRGDQGATGEDPERPYRVIVDSRRPRPHRLRLAQHLKDGDQSHCYRLVPSPSSSSPPTDAHS